MRNSNRRGMLLLVVLALLAMFAMLAVAFVVLTTQNKRSSLNVTGIDKRFHSSSKDAAYGVNILVNGTNNPVSALKVGLMEKIVGANYYSGQIQTTDVQPVMYFNNTPTYQLLTLNVPDPTHKVGCTMTM